MYTVVLYCTMYVFFIGSHLNSLENHIRVFRQYILLSSGSRAMTNNGRDIIWTKVYKRQLIN